MPPWRRLRDAFSCFGGGLASEGRRQTEAKRSGAAQLSLNAAAVTPEEPLLASVLATGAAETEHLRDDVNLAMLRDSMICNVSPAIITVFSLESRRVLHQNLNSQRYMGKRVRVGNLPIKESIAAAGRGQGGSRLLINPDSSVTGSWDRSGTMMPPLPLPWGSIGREAAATAGDLAGVELAMVEEVGEDIGQDGSSLLEHIFIMDPTKLERMLADLMEGGMGRVWKGVVRVPPNLLGIGFGRGREADSDRVPNPDPGTTLESAELMFRSGCRLDENPESFTAAAVSPAATTTLARQGDTAGVVNGYNGDGTMAKRSLAAGGGGGGVNVEGAAGGGASRAVIATSRSFRRICTAESSGTTARSFAGVPAPHTPRHTNTDNLTTTGSTTDVP
ncbi:hypothetical protein Vretifemale_12360, partial [Volvox reticuliferus]